MKKSPLIFGMVIVVLTALVIGVVRWQHRLLVPTTGQLQDAFPGETRQVLEHGSRFTLLYLEPRTGLAPGLNKTALFHGYPVLGQVQVTDPSQKQELLRALEDGIARSSHSIPACFSPRHGIHAVAGNNSVDLVICFHCQQFEIYWGKGDKLSGVSNAPQAAFDHVLSDAGITLAQQ